jgi:hypothetical protein
VGLLVAGTVLSACSQELQTAAGASERGITTTVNTCELHAGAQTGTADVTVTSRQPHLLVSLSAEVIDRSGSVVGRGSGTLGSVEPGQAYHTSVFFGLDAIPQGAVTCRVAVDSAA